VEVKKIVVSKRLFTNLSLAVAICYALLIATGGAVRLTGSGLGCADWPTCSAGHLIASDSFHPLVEFSNRMVTVAVSIVTVVTFLASFYRNPRSRKLIILAGVIFVGLAGQVVLGGMLVLTKLNPYLVALHFIFTIAILVAAVILFYFSRQAENYNKSPLVTREILHLTRLLLVVLTAVTAAGTMVTGSGPHAGGPGAKRVPVAFRDMAELHADLVLFLLGLTVALWFLVKQAHVKSSIQKGSMRLVEIMGLQGVIGYTQYFLHDQVGLVELHMIGVASLWVFLVFFYLSLYSYQDSSLSVPAAGGAVVGANYGIN
jgi:cytochrome c oxidase assembly protein subunit 15